MQYEFTAIPDEEVPRAANRLFQHLVTTYASETNKTASMWRAVPDDCLDFKPHEKTNTIRSHPGPPDTLRAAVLRPVRWNPGATRRRVAASRRQAVRASLHRQVPLAGETRLPQLAVATEGWWLTPMPFFGGLQRERIWTFWRRVLHTCHHRTQVQTWLRLAGQHVPAIYGPSGDVKWSEADPTYSVEAAKRGA